MFVQLAANLPHGTAPRSHFQTPKLVLYDPEGLKIKRGCSCKSPPRDTF
jgi:hypothetical protein